MEGREGREGGERRSPPKPAGQGRGRPQDRRGPQAGKVREATKLLRSRPQDAARPHPQNKVKAEGRARSPEQSSQPSRTRDKGKATREGQAKSEGQSEVPETTKPVREPPADQDEVMPAAQARPRPQGVPSREAASLKATKLGQEPTAPWGAWGARPPHMMTSRPGEVPLGTEQGRPIGSWRCRESNPGPLSLQQGFSVRSSHCLYSAPPVT